MKRELAEALQDFYQKVLQSEFAALRDKQLEHDNKLLDILWHFDSLYKRLDRLEDDYYIYRASYSTLAGGSFFI